MRRLFGTDGIRGTANTEPMTAETALRVATAAASHFTRGTHRHRVVIGKDTRLSGYMLEPALTAGFVSMGMDVTLVGPMPTPAVAMLTRALRADLGVMISASHNPYQDNGIKLFGPEGHKLSDEMEAEIERRMDTGSSADLVGPGSLGRANRLEDAPGRYMEFVKHSLPSGIGFEGLKVVVDCAHGAAYRVAPTVLWELGAEVVPLGVDPNGFNINQGCGATDTRSMRDAVVSHGADLGVALDGDADRLILCDQTGHVVDGDQLMALLARKARREDRLRGGGIVATVMSNLGLQRFLEADGLSLRRTPVGDRYVVETMRAEGFNIGGEQSGHIILSDHATTGDGLVAALQVMAEIVTGGQSASTATRLFEPVPQMLSNVRFDPVRADANALLGAPSVSGAIGAGERELGDRGRILIRKSGTEPLIRVMAEGDDEDLVRRVVDRIVAAIEDQANPTGQALASD